MAATAGGVTRAGHLPRQEDRREGDEGSVESEEEEEVESDDEGSEASSPSDLGEPDAGSDEDPTFDPDADGDLEVESVLRSRMSRMSISASARKGRKGAAVLKMGKEEIDLLAMVDRLKQDDQLEKLKVYECKAYLRMHKLRLTGKKEVLLNRIREHIEVKNNGEEKYPVSNFVLNCKGDACKGDVVIFEQNIYRRKKGAPREVKGRLCGQRTNAGRIIKESYGTAKQQHTFTIEILWSKGYKPWPPLHPLLIKGRNLYKDKTMRQPWPDEEERNRVIQEKHERGDVARKSRAARIHEKEIEKLSRLKRNRMKDKIKEQQNMNQKQPQELKQKVESTNTVQQRVGERKGPSPQNGEPGNTRQQHISSKAISTHHNEVFPQMGATRNFQQEFNGNQVSSNQHGGPQPFSEPTHTQQMFKDSHHHHSYQQRNEVLSQEVAMITSRKAFLGRQAPSQHNGGSGSTKHHPISSKPTPSTFKYPQQPPKHQNHNEEDGPKRTYREHHHQNNADHSTEYDESSFHPQGKFTQHASPYQHGSNFHQNAPGSHQAHQPQRPRNQHQSKAYYATKYNDSFQPQGKSTHHANAYQHSSSSHQYAQANHRVHQPLRPRNQDFNSSDPSYGQDYHHQGCHDYRGITRGQYHPQQSQNQNYYSRRPMTQDQYLTQQNHHPNYNDHRKTNQKQYHPRQNQPQQFLEQQPQPRPCRYYYKQGWCPYGEGCWYSHDI
ncbi:hypothetical protein SETIT_9G251500v2 [Setaria italica]|uniref:C3H1-type domain-containing protein n=1 Tax=Setaria italica TaxID=4555 RepID=K4AMX1_SETIT|nr:zinc finger CCCH domain-containing protein 62 [Setaria italica]RCV42889.1 hypothetical protein SETIT_9G251500v2 [Setaria italica]